MITSSTLAIIITIVVMFLFISNITSPGVTSVIAALAMGTLLPEVKLSAIYSGFGGNTATLCAGMCVVSEALFYTGVGQRISAKISKTFLVQNERIFCAAVAFICTIQSAFMSNNGTCAMWMTLIATIAVGSKGKIRSKIAIFPAATGCIVGGGMTLVGSTSQAVANGMLENIPGYEAGMQIFDMTQIAWPLIFVEVIYWLTIGYDILLKVLKPENPDFDKDNAFAVPNKYECNEIKVAPWKGKLTVAVLIGSIVCFVLCGIAPFNKYMNIATVPMAAAAILFAFRVVPTKETLAKLPWDTIITIGTISILGTGLTNTGAGRIIADSLLDIVGKDVSPHVLLVSFIIIGGFLTLFLQNAGTVSMLIPIAAPLAIAKGVSVMPFVVSLAVATNMAIATPMGTAVNVQILPVGYKFNDFVKIGGPLWVAIMVVLYVMASIVYF